MGVTEKTIKNFVLQMFIQSTWSEKGQQKSGLLFALSGLTKKEKFKEKKKKIEIFNTNPYMASYLTGTLLKASPESVKYMESYYAAVGDDVIWSTLRPALLLFSTFLIMIQGIVGALGFLLMYNIICQGIRLLGFPLGIKYQVNPPKQFMDTFLFLKFIFLNIGIITAGILFTSFLNFPHEILKISVIFVSTVIFYVSKLSPTTTLFVNLLVLTGMEVLW